MRGSVLASGLVHLAILAVLFVMRMAMPLKVRGEDVVQVSLVDPSAIPTITPPSREPPVPTTEKPPEPPKEEDEGVRIEPKKPPPSKSKPEPAKPTPPTSEPMRFTQAGVPGLSVGVAGDANGVDLGGYLELVRNKVLQNWSPPGGLTTGGVPVRSVVYFRIHPGGQVSDIKLELGSGREFFDRAAQRAVMLSEPMPKLPAYFPGSELGVHFGFNYVQP